MEENTILDPEMVSNLLQYRDHFQSDYDKALHQVKVATSDMQITISKSAANYAKQRLDWIDNILKRGGNHDE